MRRGLIVILLTATTIAGAQAPTTDTFENTTAGISLARPTGWQTASLQQVQANRDSVRLADRELQEAMQKLATAPLFVFTKYAEPYATLNPSIQVTLRPLGELTGSSPEALMKIAIGPIQKAFPDFAFVKDIVAVQVSGLPAAHMKAKYTMRTRDGQEFKALSRLWLVPRGAFMFMISHGRATRRPGRFRKRI